MTVAPGEKSHRRHGDRFTVVVLPSGLVGKEVLDAALAWTRSGLLTPAAWVLPEDVDIRDGSAPSVTCHFAGPWGEARTSLFDTLGQYRRDLVRVVCSQVLDSASAVDASQIHAAGRVLRAARYSVPAVIEKEHVGRYGTRVLGVNVITGVTGLLGVSRQVVPHGWDVTVVSSPEDRRDPSRANTFVRAGENLIAVALNSTATVGGLFAGVPQGPFDEVPGDASSIEGKTLVMRTTVRAVIGERTVQEVARRAVAAAPAVGGPVRSEPDAFTVAYTDSLVAETADWLDGVDRAALTRQSETPEDQEAIQFISIRQGFSAFMRFYGQALVAGPAAVWSLVVRGAENFVTGALVGGSSSSGIALTIRASETLGPELLSLEEQDIRKAQQAIRMAAQQPVRMPTAEMWQSVRDAAVSLLDGSDPPSGSPVELDGARRVLLASPELIAPDPTDTFTLPESIAKQIGVPTAAKRVISACAPTVAAEMRDKLEAECSRLQAAAEQAANDLEEATAEAEAEEDPEGPAHAALVSAQAKATAAAAELGRIASERDRLDAWLSTRSSSLMWTVGSRVQTRLEEARAEEEQAARLATTPSGLDSSTPVRLRRRYLYWFSAWLVVAILAVVLLVKSNVEIIAGVRNVVPAAETWQSWLLVVALLGLWLTLIVRSWYVGTLRYMRRFTTAWNQRASALWRHRSASSDRRRLQAAAQQAEDWADVVGWSTHTPWSTAPQPLQEEFVTPDPQLLPESMRLAEPSLDDVSLDRATDLAIARLTRRGWRRRSYERLVAAGLRARGSDEVARALSNVDTDTADKHGARAQLREALSTGEPQQAVVAEVIDEAADELRAERLGVTQLQVQVHHPAPDEPAQVEDAEFLGQALVHASPFATETWSERARVSGLHADLRSLAWAPDQARAWASPMVDVRPREQIPGERRDLVEVVVRVDLTDWLLPESLKLFEPPAPSAGVVLESTNGDFV